jgi:GH15 family glucan-1,4-alpha-glucosidase
MASQHTHNTSSSSKASVDIAASKLSDTKHTCDDATVLPIEEHALIGNMYTTALISTDANVAFYCYPHHDSPTMFASILDPHIGGHYSIKPLCDTKNVKVSFKQQYLHETNVLITRFLTNDGVAQVSDYMPVDIPEGHFMHGWLIRQVEIIRGKFAFAVNCTPAFNYARDEHDVEIVSHGARFKSKDLTMVLTSTRQHKWTIATDSSRPGPGVTMEFELLEGQKEVFIFRESQRDKNTNPWRDEKTHDRSGHPATIETTDQLRLSTVRFWREWISKSEYKGRWREHVHRSALALKLLTFEPTGAVVASPTTSLPETPGGHRNWDYRYTWIRDSSFTMYALLRLGFRQEARKFMQWIEARCEDLNPDGSLGIMYGIRGEKHLPEIELDHLSGYKGARPVRVGNGAAGQLQLDIYGELMDTVYLSDKFAEPISYDLFVHLRRLVDWVCENWQRKDDGIWEVRSGAQHFTYSKMMTWVAVDRAIRLAEKRSFPADIHRWRTVRDTIYEEIHQRAFDTERKAFTQFYGSSSLDAACLVMPMVHFLSPTDPRFVGTLDQLMRPVKDDGLVSNGLVFRYNVEHTDDGLSGEEGTFSICSFWAVEALARVGEYHPEYLERARDMFEHMISFANHVGLYSEEIGRRGEALGNAVQAFTHISLISSAYKLNNVLGNK